MTGLLRYLEKVAFLLVIATVLNRLFTFPVVHYTVYLPESILCFSSLHSVNFYSCLIYERQTGTAGLSLILKCNGLYL